MVTLPCGCRLPHFICDAHVKLSIERGDVPGPLYYRTKHWPDQLNLGHCTRCGAPIIEFPAEAERKTKQDRWIWETQVYDTPVYGERMQCLCAPFPCGHRFAVEKRCVKRPDGKYEYRVT